MIFEPEDFIARLAALVPKPRAHLTRYHGVFAPASPERARIVPRTRAAAANEGGKASATGGERAMSWAQRLKRVFAIDIETCRQCGGRLRVIASIEAPAVIVFGITLHTYSRFQGARNSLATTKAASLFVNASP